MAIVETVPATAEVGREFTISGTGYTHSGSVIVNASNRDGNGGLSVKVTLVADGSGVLAANLLKLVALEEGHVDVSITDVTAVATHTHVIEVFHVD